MPTREEQIQFNQDLHQSIVDGKGKVFKQALKDGAQIESRDSEGLTALARAARLGKGTYVDALIKQGSVLEVVDHNGNTPLILASFAGDIGSVRYLIDAGANPLHKNVENGAFLTYIPEEGKGNISADDRADLLEIYQEATSKASKLLDAALAGNEEDFNEALEDGAVIQATDPSGTNLASYAAAGGNLDILKKIVKEGISIHQPDNNGCTALSTAASCGKSDIVKYLIEQGADIGHTNKIGKTVANIASDSAMHVNADSLKLDTTELTEDQIEEAIANALNQYQEVSTALVAANAANQKMIRAARSGNVKNFQAALESAQPSAQFEGKNPLLIAAENGHTEMLETIATALPETLKGTDRQGHNAALLAAANGHVETFEALVALEVNPHGLNNEGANAVSLAAGAGKKAMIEHLATNYRDNEQGEDTLQQEDQNGWAAYDYANRYASVEKEQLRTSGAKKRGITDGQRLVNQISTLVEERQSDNEEEEELDGFETPRDKKPSSRPTTPDNSAENLSQKGRGQGRGQGE